MGDALHLAVACAVDVEVEVRASCTSANTQSRFRAGSLLPWAETRQALHMGNSTSIGFDEPIPFGRQLGDVYNHPSQHNRNDRAIPEDALQIFPWICGLR